MKTAKAILVCMLICVCLPCLPQEEEKQTLIYRSTMLGVGHSRVYDTYLSDLSYTGLALSYRQESMKMLHLFQGNAASQQLFNIDFSSTSNKTKTAEDFSGFLEYNYGLFYRFSPAPRLQLFVGSQANGMIGFIYNTRNGNNPASAKVHMNLTLSGAAAYGFSIGSQEVRIRYQVYSPFIGLFFSPHYGQSYYEISLGDNDGLVHFGSFHNNIYLRNTLSCEIPFYNYMLKCMYMNTYYETRINQLDTKLHTNIFLIGFSREFFSISGRKKSKGNYKSIFD